MLVQVCITISINIVCLTAPAGSYIKGEHGEADCSDRYEAITQNSVCATACSELGLNYNGEVKDSGTTAPKGCFINTGENDDEYTRGCDFNTVPGIGGNSGSFRAICAPKAGTSASPGPSGIVYDTD